MRGKRSVFEAKGAPPPVDLDLRALEIFVAVIEAGGMTQAARRLGVTQAAVSQTIAGLETALGAQLFDRAMRPLAVTPAGAVLQARAGALLQDARDAAAAVRQAGGGALAHLHLAMADSVAATIGPYIVSQLRGLASQWSVYAGLSPAHNAALKNREADIVISPDALEDEPGLERRHIFREPFVLLLPASYTGPADDLAAIANSLDLIRFSARSLIGKQVERHLRRLSLEAPGNLEFDTADALAAMVAGGVGWAITTPLCLLQSEGQLERVRCLPMPAPALSRTITVIARKGELGEAPARIAAMSAAALLHECLPRWRAIAPWLADAVEIIRPDPELIDSIKSGESALKL